MKRRIAIAVAAAVLGVSGDAAWAALTINLNFGSFDTSAPGGTTLAGGGTPSAVVRAAADYWETAFAASSTSITHTITVQWGPQTGSTLATGGTSWFIPSGNLVDGELTFDNDGSSQFFVDPTPYSNTEWSGFNATTADLGGGQVNVQRRYTSPTGSASGRSDMLSVAIHEIGHALGLLDGYPRWDTAADADSDPNDIDVTAPRQFAGSQITVSGGHTSGATLTNTNMSSTLITGQRKLLSEVDILLLGQIQNFNNINLNPQPIPEPAAAAVLAIAATGLLVRRRRNA